MPEITRRKFIQLTVLGGAVGSSLLASGCRNERIYKEEVAGRYGGEGNRVLPYVNQPDGLEDGVPQYFATACGMCPAGCGLFIRTMGGRAVKVEGNPAHPVSGGKTCARGQAALQHLYNPDRLRFPVVRRGGRQSPAVQTDWDSALDQTHGSLAKGDLAVLVDSMTIARSPSLMRVASEFTTNRGGRLYTYGLIDDAPWRAAARAVYGRDQLPAYQLDQADCIIAFNSNFLEAWPSPVYYSRLFGEFRQGPRRAQGDHGLFYFVGPRMSMTAAEIRPLDSVQSGTECIVANALLALMQNPATSVDQAATRSGVSQADLTTMAAAFSAAKDRALAIAGDGLLAQLDAADAITSVESMNAAARSRCVGFGEAALPLASRPSHFEQISELIAGIDSAAIQNVLILGQPNPIFTLPRAVGLAEALDKAAFIAAITPFEDETTAHADIVLPARSFLESWNDNIPLVIPPGEKIATLRQPIIDPSYIRTIDDDNHISPDPWMDTRETADILIDLAKRLGKPLTMGSDARETTRNLWASIGQADLTATDTDNDRPWIAALAKGGDWAKSTDSVHQWRPSSTNSLNLVSQFTPDQFALHLFPHIYWTDGRNSNLGWLQELPDPMTSAVWNNWIEINRHTAHEMGILTGDIVRITTPHGYLDAPAVPSPGIHPRAIAMPLGNGHAPNIYGRNPRGSNPLVILDPVGESRTGSLAYNTTFVHLAKIRDAVAGYHAEENTLVLVQDRPGGQEPEAVKDLIHTSAKDWKTASRTATKHRRQESIFNREE